MWIRRNSPALARMPSMRPATLNPRAPTLAAAGTSPAHAARPATAKSVAPGVAAAKPAAKGAAAPAPISEQHDAAARAGGFHESSYELQSGLQMTESEWPDDVTVPGALGDR